MYKIKCGGIYMIKNIKTEHYYIGMSVDIFSRWQSHYTSIKNFTHSSTELMMMFLKGEPTDWTFQILEHISLTKFKNETGFKGKKLNDEYRKLLLNKEKEWMSKWSKTYSLNKNKNSFG